MTKSPSGAERSVIDGFLDERVDTSRPGSHVAYGGLHRAKDLRHLLLPSLQAVQASHGWISPGALNYVCERLGVPPADAYGVATFYALLTTEPTARRVAHVCDDLVCRRTGAIELIEQLERTLGAELAGDDATWRRSPCLGLCERAPAVFYQLAGEIDTVSAPAEAASATDILTGAATAPPPAPPTPALGALGEPRLLRRVGRVDPDSLDGYRTGGGYQALERAIELGGAAVIAELERSGLRGRGGAAFPIGAKWRAVAERDGGSAYVVCNADESEPGTFKDRMLIEGDPFAIVEAMTIAGLVIGADTGYVYVRGEYPHAARRLAGAVRSAESAGLLGADVAGSGLRFTIEIRHGGGAYICGEETALFNSIEGFRGEPRQKPPFPTDAGLFGRPTVVNNVETLVNVLEVVLHGGERFASTGTAESTGTKLFCVSGDVAAPGTYEVPFGTTLGELLSLAGGSPPDLRAVLVGGAAGSFVGADALDLPLTFEATREAGVGIGSGAVIVFAGAVDFVDVARRIAAFFRDETCGQCVPCRVGTVRQEEALARFAGDGAHLESALLADIDRAMTDSSICGLGQTAGRAVQSAIALGLIGGDTA